MTKLEEKYNEFREAFREAMMNDELKYKITKSDCPGYNAEVIVDFGKTVIEFSVANTFVCYHEDLLRGIFTQDDIKKLNRKVCERFSKDEATYARIETLKRELAELERKVA